MACVGDYLLDYYATLRFFVEVKSKYITTNPKLTTEAKAKSAILGMIMNNICNYLLFLIAIYSALL